MIKFHSNTDDNTHKPTLRDVKENQFFLDEYEYFCQKISNYEYHRIAAFDGTPLSLNVTADVDPDMPIKKILPHITKITWE